MFIVIKYTINPTFNLVDKLFEIVGKFKNLDNALNCFSENIAHEIKIYTKLEILYKKKNVNLGLKIQDLPKEINGHDLNTIIKEGIKFWEIPFTNFEILKGFFIKLEYSNSGVVYCLVKIKNKRMRK